MAKAVRAFVNEEALPWTARQIRERLGFSTDALPGDERLGSRGIAMIREAGIERMEICGLHEPTHYDYHDKAQICEITKACRAYGVSLVSVHAPGLPYNCPYEDVRRAVVKEAVCAARVAEEMGAGVFVAHFGVDQWGRKTVCEILEQLDDGKIRLTVENTPGNGDLREFAAAVDSVGSERFGMTVDIGHPRDEDGVNPFIKHERARETMRLCGARLLHLHLHDFADTDHYPPFDGNIQWLEIMQALREMNYGGEFMFEVGGGTTMPLEDRLAKTAAFPQKFVLRYGTAA